MLADVSESVTSENNDATSTKKCDLETDFREGKLSLTNCDGFREGFSYFSQKLSCQTFDKSNCQKS